MSGQRHIGDANNIDGQASFFNEQVAGLDKSASYLIYWHTGVRSANAAGTMLSAGFTNVVDLAGGGTAWSAVGPVLSALHWALSALRQAGLRVGPQAGVFVGAATGAELAAERNLRIRLVEIVELIERLPVVTELHHSALAGIRSCFVDPIHDRIRPTGVGSLAGYMDNMMAGLVSGMVDP